MKFKIKNKAIITLLLCISMLTESLAFNQLSVQAARAVKSMEIKLEDNWTYANKSVIKDGKAKLYYATTKRKGIVVCINAGHGTKGVGNKKTDCHPDGSGKVTGGTTKAGETQAIAVSSGTTMSDGKSEAQATLALAKVVKDALLAAGYDVLMIRESDDVQLDNVARTVMANNNADCHIALHYDGENTDTGAFYCGVPNNQTYRAMSPVKENWKRHEKLGKCLIAGLKNKVKINTSIDGRLEVDLTQTSYSTIPSVDLEVGTTVSDRSSSTLNNIANGIVTGLNKFY